MNFQVLKAVLFATVVTVLSLALPKLSLAQSEQEMPEYFNGIEFNFEDLVKLIQEKKIKSVDSLLPYLPKSLRSNFTLVYESSSLQKASFAKPRVIMFQPDGKMACTFIENPNVAGNDSLECYQFRTESNTFDFREIKFPTPENGYTEAEISLSNMTVDKSISCKLCHGQNPRPNWEGYSTWRGVYGSLEDSYAMKRGMSQDQLNQLNQEKSELLKFKRSLSRTTRYSKLIFRSPHPNSPFYPYSKKVLEVDYRFRPNTRFTEVVMTLTAKRNATLLLNRGLKEASEFSRLVKCENDADGSTSKELVSFLRKRFSAVEWSPYFRSYRDGCISCGKYGNIDLDPNQYDYTDGSYGFALNSLVAEEIISEFVKKGLINRELLKKNEQVYSRPNFLAIDITGFWENYPAMIANLSPMQIKRGWNEQNTCDLLNSLFK